MNRQAFRSVCAWVRPEIGQPVSNYFRSFSTTPSWQIDDDSSPKPETSSRQQRSKEAANEIRSLINNRPARPATAAADETTPKIVDVRTLPRGGLRGRGGFRGRGALSRGGARGGSTTGATTGPLTGGFTGAPSGGPSSRFARGGIVGGGPRGRGRGRGRGGRGRGGRGGGRGGKRDMEAQSKEELLKKREREVDMDLFVEQSEKEFDDAIRFGTRTIYKPELTAESLLEYMPAVASKTAAKSATVLQNLNYLGTGDHIATPLGLQAGGYGDDIEANGMRYFAVPEDKNLAEAYLQEKRYTDAIAKAAADAPEGEEPTPVERNNEPIIAGVEESIKKVILEKAIAGQHEALKKDTDPVTLARNWHLRNETWTGKEADAFEKKLTELLSKVPVKKAQAKKTT